MQLFDTHAHLDQDAFDSDRPQVLARAAQAGVTRILAVGVTRASSEACLALAHSRNGKLPALYAAVGVHPNHAAEAAADDWDRVVELAERDGVAALGETGLDRHWDFTPFERQQDYFERHLTLSRATGLPVVIHTRDCDADMLAMLRDAYRHGPLNGVMHSFVGDAAMAAECLAMGLFISFAGMATYKKSDAIREVAGAIPGDRLLVETDAPYLSPEPVRKVRRNEPAHVLHTAGVLADVRGETLTALARQTTANALELFSRIPRPSGG